MSQEISKHYHNSTLKCHENRHSDHERRKSHESHHRRCDCCCKCVYGKRGSSGPRGLRGFKGERGERGEKGEKGERGSHTISQTFTVNRLIDSEIPTSMHIFSFDGSTYNPTRLTVTVSVKDPNALINIDILGLDNNLIISGTVVDITTSGIKVIEILEFNCQDHPLNSSCTWELRGWLSDRVLPRTEETESEYDLLEENIILHSMTLISTSLS